MKSTETGCHFLLLGLVFSFSFCQPKQDVLQVSIVSGVPEKNIIALYMGYDKGGNTSLAFDAKNSYKWSGLSPYKKDSWGYFTANGEEIPYIKRDRDLGQTFTYNDKDPKKLTAITVSTGYGTNVVRANMYGKSISIQIFEVFGTPSINNNGSDSSVQAYHGFPHNRLTDSISHIRDDYFTGEIYTSSGLFTGAFFPGKKEFGFPDNMLVPADHRLLKGKYLRFEMPKTNPIILHPKKKYAFLIMIDNIGIDCGFTLANNYRGSYLGGHAIRRDGNGNFPPVPADPLKNFTDAANDKAFASAHFPSDFRKRTSILPGTNGYPDVDTLRDLLFVIEGQ